MPLLVLLVVAITFGSLVSFLTWRYPSPGLASPTPTVAAAKAVGRELAQHSRLRRTIKRRLNPEIATGLALTVALGFVLLGGIVLAAFAYLVRTNSQLVDLDASVAQWGADHTGAVSERGLSWITHLGDTELVIVLAVVLALVEYIRRPGRWTVPFLVVVILGQNLLTNGLKELLDRVRPTLNPIAETLGPSFPSGHSATAAAFYAAAALVIGRGRSSRARALIAGSAAAIAVAVACTRVLLDFHWLSDVVAGLALGWAWFAVCSIAFGGRMLKFGAVVEEVVEAADAESRRTAVTQAH
ncbi:MAG: phosphatase PAP2 family protein [Actinomycetota bacterium]|nr:phosphatase PAP2 family protein [Actinomycetota bacterium]